MQITGYKCKEVP